MSTHSQPRFTAYLGETGNQFSDKQSIRSNQCGSELSGVAKNLHQFLQNNMVIMQPTRVGIFDAHQPSTYSSNGTGGIPDMQGGLQIVKQHARLNQDLEEYQCSEDRIASYPLKRANSTIDDIRGAASDTNSNERQTIANHRASSNKPPGSKTVRFDIRESLKNIMSQQSNSDEQTFDDENDPRTLNQQFKRQTRKQKAPRGQLKFKRNSSPNTRSASGDAKNNKADTISGESNTRSSEGQKPRKLDAKTRQLALKYKKSADQMKLKKFGIQPPVSYPDQSTYSTIENPKLLNEDESRETPNFSLAVSKKDLTEDTNSTPQEYIQEEVPQPLPEPQNILMHFPSSLEFEDINHLSYDNDNQIGTIVKSNKVVLSQQRVHVLQAAQIRENSTNSSRISQFQPGMIVRQRSQSPAVSSSMQLSNLAYKQSEQKASNVGQIVRTNSQQALLTTKTITHPQIHHIPTSPDRPRHENVLQRNSSRLQESPSVQLNLPYPSNPPSTLTDSTNKIFKKHCFGTLWEHFVHCPPAKAKFNLMQLLNHQQNLECSLHQALTHPHLSISMKLSCLRKTLPQLVFTSLSEDIEQLIYLKERREQRMTDYKKALFKSNDSQFGTLKADLLRDICDRLTQKIVVTVLRINVRVKRETVERFDQAYREYIVKQSARRAITVMRLYLERTAEQREYLMNVKQQLKIIKTRQILNAWYQLKPRRIQYESKFEQCVSHLQHNLTQRCYKSWIAHTLNSKLKVLNNSICNSYINYKYRFILFLRWTYQRRSHTKIKRKALQILAHHNDHHHIATLSDEQWFNQAKLNEVERFRAKINDDLEEREILSKRITRKKWAVIPSMRVQQRKERSSGGRIQRKVNHTINDDEKEVKRSMDLDLKYKIHSALVMQQNSSNKQRPSSQQRDLSLPRKQLNYSSFVSDGEHYHSSGINRSSSQQFRTKNPIALPPYFFKKTEPKPTIKRSLQKPYDPTNPADLVSQLTSHAHNLQRTAQQSISYNHHFIASLRANAHDVLNPDSFSGLTDYIQYGLASRCNRILFQKLFKTKVQSVLFGKWRERFHKKRYVKSLSDIHAGNICKQVLIEWLRVVKQKKIWIREFQRTKTIQKFYGLFQKWARFNREIIKKEKSDVKMFQKKTILKAWLKYLNRQGNELMSIIKAQSYHRQSLMSRSLVAMYQHHLQGMRVRNFLHTKVFKKFFIQNWLKVFKQRQSLRKLLIKLSERQELVERLKYQREYEAKQAAFIDWHLLTMEKKVAIQKLTADTHYRQTLAIKTFFQMKKMYQASAALKKLSGIVSRQAVKPSFDKIYESFSSLVSSENQFKNYRRSFKITKLFMGWKELAIRSKLCKLFYKKLILKHFYNYVHRRNHVLPSDYRKRRLQSVFLARLTHDVRAHWHQRRSDLILRQLTMKRRERLVKLCYLRLLENVVQRRNARLVTATVGQFREHKLADKVIRVLKRRWLKRKRDRLMWQVAEDYCQQRESKKVQGMKESMMSSANDYEMVRLRNHQVFEDPVKMMKYRVLNAWKMFIFDRLRRNTVLNRYLLFKKRMMSLRCFLGWRSIAKYEQSSQGQMSVTQRSSSVQAKRKNVIAPQSVSDYVTREHSPQREYQGYQHSVDGVSRGSGTVRNNVDTRQYLFDNRLRSQQESIGQPASATFGVRSIGSNFDSLNDKKFTVMIDGDTPRDCQLRSTSLLKDQQFNGTSSLFDELETIFQKNRKWLDEQFEREEFLKEMAAHYNQQLSLEINSLKGSSIATSIASRQYI